MKKVDKNQSQEGGTEKTQKKPTRKAAAFLIKILIKGAHIDACTQSGTHTRNARAPVIVQAFLLREELPYFQQICRVRQLDTVKLS